MSNYKQTSVVGESWVRASRVLIENPLGAPSVIRFVEDTVLNLQDGSNVTTAASSVVMESLKDDNKTESFNLLNPATGEVTGTSTYEEVYAMLHSLYMHLANKRDANLA